MGDTIAIIPARSGSKGIKDKNISDILGFPMIAYSIYAAKMIEGISRIIVSTDSEEYAQIAVSFGAEVPFLRPAEISKSTSQDIEYLDYTLKELERNGGVMPEYIVLLRPTTPLRDVSLVSDAMKELHKRKDASAIVSVSLASECAYKWALVSEKGYLTSPFPNMDFDDVNLPRQSFPQLYVPDGYVDVLRSDEIIINHSVYGKNAVPFYIEKGAIDIDRMEDLEKVRDERLLQQNIIYNKLVEDKRGLENA